MSRKPGHGAPGFFGGCRVLELEEDLAEGLSPVHQDDAELMVEFGAVEAGVRRSWGGGGVLGRGDGDDVGQGSIRVVAFEEADGFFGEAVPGGFAYAGGVIDAREAGQGGGEGLAGGGKLASLHDAKGEDGEVAAPGGGSVLVGYDAEVFALTGEFENGEEEVLSRGAVDPGGSEDEVGGPGFGEGLFSGELAGAVDAGRVRGIG